MRAALRTYAGLWVLVGVLGTAMMVTISSVGPTATRIENAGLQRVVEAAPYQSRDLISTRPAGSATEAATMHTALQRRLPPVLADVVQQSWQYHDTAVVPGNGTGAGLVGDGVTTSDYGLAPVVTLHHQPDLTDALTVTHGDQPASAPGGDVVEVMVEASVADALGLEVDRDYTLYPGVLGLVTHPRTGQWVAAGSLAPVDTRPELTVRVTGLFVADNPDDQVWEHMRARDASFVTLPIGDPPHPPAPRGALITDQEGFATALAHPLAQDLAATASVRLRLDESLLDADWAEEAAGAVARMGSDPRLRSVPVTTGLSDLLAEFHRAAAATRAVIAVVTAGILVTLLGLLVLAARLILERRRTEVALLRARGGSLRQVTVRVALEALLVIGLAAAAAWPLHRWAVGEPVWPVTGDRSLLVGAAVAALTWLVVPAVVALAGRRAGVVAAREDLGRRRSHPARLTVEVALVALAGFGYLLVRQRGLATAGVDPYLSAVPVLLALAAGVVALRVYPWPLRALAAGARRLRGTVGFIGLARAGRAAPGTALALLVLVLAVTVGGFTGAVSGGVADARQAGAVQSLGAHVRVSLADLPEGTVAAVSDVPGVEAVAVAARGGVVRHAPVRDGRALSRRVVQGAEVVMVDVPAYQALLDRLGVDVRLPEALRSATVDSDPLPVLAAPEIGDRNLPTVWIEDVERPVVVAGEVAGLPGPDRGEPWMLVPRRAWPEPGTGSGSGEAGARSVTGVTGYELLVAGEDADPAAVRRAVADLPEVGEVSVSSLSEVRARLEDSGFNEGLTLVLAVGAAGAAVGGVLAVGLALVVQARARGRVLSLLRTMGLSSRQARGVLLVEMLPPTVLAVSVGAVTGSALPVLFGAALGLDRFTGGVPVTLQVEPGVVAVFAAVVLGLVVTGVTIEAVVNRSLGLGRTLRVE